MAKYIKRKDGNIARAGLANKGRKQSEQHKKNKSIAMRNSDTKDKVVCIQKVEGGKVMVFSTLAAAARFIGCSRQLTAQAAREGASKTTYSAKGYLVRCKTFEEAAKCTSLA